jgi:hypothetical protein
MSLPCIQNHVRIIALNLGVTSRHDSVQDLSAINTNSGNCDRNTYRFCTTNLLGISQLEPHGSCTISQLQPHGSFTISQLQFVNEELHVLHTDQIMLN